MDTVLIVLGVLGLGAIVISAYVFMVAARNYVSAENDVNRRPNKTNSSGKPRVMRASRDRRSGRPVQFPLTVNGIVVPEERRHTPDRRRAA
jgi:hypothetical protein